jgi:hypothetical protein
MAMIAMAMIAMAMKVAAGERFNCIVKTRTM